MVTLEKVTWFHLKKLIPLENLELDNNKYLMDFLNEHNYKVEHNYKRNLTRMSKAQIHTYIISCLDLLVYFRKINMHITHLIIQHS
jgi:hypothetical protein